MQNVIPLSPQSSGVLLFRRGRRWLRELFRGKVSGQQCYPCSMSCLYLDSSMSSCLRRDRQPDR